MGLRTEIFEAYKNHILEHPEENRKGSLAVRDFLEHSPLNWNGTVDSTIQIPKVFDDETLDDFRRIVRTTHRIFEKVIRRYREDPQFRRLFPFSEKLEELILLPAPYQGELPMARFDIFYNEETGDFRFCEINTDGTAAMIRDLEMGRALINNPAHQAVIRKYDMEQLELFDTWVETFMRLYDTYPRKIAHPNVAIIDFLENANVRDQEEFARRFQKAGINCEICDVRSLIYRDGKLYSAAGNRVDAIYRRAVTSDIMEHYEEVTDFLNAVKDDAVFLAGAFATQIIHNKWLFYVLHQDQTKAFLTEEEQDFVKKHVPLTTQFDPEFITLEEVQNNKDQYMIKPMDAYASKGIYAAGREYTQTEWDALTRKVYGQGCLCQQYCEQYLTENIDFAWGDGQWHPFMNMHGLYAYNGEFAGFLMRMACEENIIVAHENERTVPVFRVKGRKAF